MNFFGMRAARAPLAILVAIALVVSGIIFASPHLAARATGATSTELGTHNPNPLIEITDTKVTNATGQKFDEAPGPLSYEGRARFSFNWSAVNAAKAKKLKVDDSFTVELPKEFEAQQVTPFELGAGGKVLGRCYPSIKAGVSTVVCKFTDAIDAAIATGAENIFGTVFGGMKVVKETGATVSFNVQGLPVEVPVPDGKPVVKPKGTWTPSKFTKANDGQNKNPQVKSIRWYYHFSGAELAAQFGGKIPDALTFTDTLTGDHTFVDDTYELYIWKYRDPSAPEEGQVGLNLTHGATQGVDNDRKWITLASNRTAGKDGRPATETDFQRFGKFEVTSKLSEDKKTATYTITKTAGQWDMNAHYRFLYYTTTGDRVEGLTYYNKVNGGAVGDRPILVGSSQARYVSNAGGTIQLERNYGTFRVTKQQQGLNTGLQPNSTMKLKAKWELPNGQQASDFAHWTAPENPVTFTIPVPGSVVYGQGDPRPFPIGTVITLTEELDSTEPKLDNNRQWDAPEFVVGGVSTKNSVTFTIGADTQFVDLYNTLIEKKNPSVSVGDFVWFDADKNGKQDKVEKGLGGAVLRISTADGAPVTDVMGAQVADITTEDDGRYLFKNLPTLPKGQKYKVTVVTPPAGYVATTPEADQVDPGLNSNTGEALTSVDLDVDLAEDLGLDFGFIKPAVSVGDFVWFDADKNGLQDNDEPGIENVTLTISRSDNATVKNADGTDRPAADLTTTTNNKGLYSFTGLEALPADTHYVVTVTAPAGYEATVEKPGADSKKDSSAQGGKVESKDLITDGAEDLSLDFGFIKPAVSVGDLVWFDTNKDGKQDNGEPGIKNIPLELSRSDKGTVKNADGSERPTAELTITTNDAGQYSFDNLQALPAGVHYVVTVKAPTELAPTKTAADSQPQGLDSSNDSSKGSATSTDLTKDGQKDDTLDFGFVHSTVSVGNFVWFDTNKDGKQDADEPGIEGVTLAISRTDGKPVYYVDDLGKADPVPVQPVATKADGSYLFENLPVLPEKVFYTVKVFAPAKYAPTKAQAPQTTPENDSSLSTADSGALTKDGDKDLSLDFGFVNARVSVGDLVWFDTNKDGKQDDDEPGIVGVELTISGPDGKKVAIDADGNPYNAVFTTKDDGKYLFENLPVLTDAERYTVEITRFPSDLTPTIPQAPGTSVDNDSSRGVAESVKPLVADGREDRTLDFGFVKATVSVSDLVWLDTNKDGKQDEGEPGVEGIELTLTGPDGKPVMDVDGKAVGVATTDKDGKYTFGNLPVLQPGESYTVTIAYPAKYTHTVAQAEGTTKDNDSSTGSASSGDLIKDGDKDSSLDFGLVYATVAVGDFVWHDANGNGRQDAGEAGISGVELTLTGPDGKPVTDVDGKLVPVTTTDKDGKYVFENLPVLEKGQKYTVTVSKAPAGFVATTAKATGDTSNDSSTTTVSSTDLLKHGDKDLTLDFGFVKAKETLKGNKVAMTGTNAATAAGLAALIVLLGSAALLVRRRMTH